MGNAKRTRPGGRRPKPVAAPTVAPPQWEAAPEDMPRVETMAVVPDVDADKAGFPLDPALMVGGGDLTAIGLMGNATQEGHAGVLMVVTLPDGRQVAAQTTWALLRAAITTLDASPVVAP